MLDYLRSEPLIGDKRHTGTRFYTIYNNHYLFICCSGGSSSKKSVMLNYKNTFVTITTFVIYMLYMCYTHSNLHCKNAMLPINLSATKSPRTD